MHCLPECYHCLENLARGCATLATDDSQKREKALEVALAFLKDNFSLDCVSTGLAAEIQRIIRLKTENDDPFAAVKKKEIALAGRFAKKFDPSGQASLPELVQFAAKGNGFDFFQDLQVLERQFQEEANFSRNETVALEQLLQDYRLEGGKKIIFLADNAGECLFDLPLVKHLEQFAEVFYVVKESPVQNDLSLIDLEQNGLIDRFPNPLSTGTDSPGLDLDAAAPSFKNHFAQSNLIVAKGMGHYETLTELSLPQPVFLIFQVKCNPVAQNSGLSRQSYAAYFMA